MEKLANKAVKAIWEMFPEEVQYSQLEDGDHIYVFRAGYSHHGIYVGRKNELQYVIHFGKVKRSCTNCGHKKNREVELVITCLDCFFYEGTLPFSSSLYRYRYGACRLSLIPGTCTTLKPKPPEEVVRVAYKLLEEGFGNYNLLLNNCEDFATYCKTGTARSSQATSAANTSLAAGVALAAGSILYCFHKIKQEKRRDKRTSRA